MKLVSNWREILRRAWSIRLMLAAGALSAAEIVIPLFEDSMPRGVFAALSAIATAGAFYARLVAQKDVSDAD